MSFTMAAILIHSEHVPAGARSELRAALASSPEKRREHLTSAARILYAESGLDCSDARELVGLAIDREDDGCDCDS